jgi:hypothetical protein
MSLVLDLWRTAAAPQARRRRRRKRVRRVREKRKRPWHS